MGVQCHILINRPADGVHKAGETVSGSVRYSIDKPFEYKYIIISLDGEGVCMFTSLRPSLTISQMCIGEHNFVREVKYLSPGEKHGKNNILPVGTYEEDFSFKLPMKIPQPYKDKFCKLTYRVAFNFRKSTLFGHKEFSAPINVSAYVTQEQPEGSTPFELEKTLHRPLSQKTHTINVKGVLSNTLFAPGEDAHLSFKVTNNTDTTIYSIETKLVCYTIYKGDHGRTKEDVTIIQESAVETPGVPADNVANLTSIMHVPEHLFSIQNCDVIKKQYKVRVTMILHMPYTNDYTEIPVVIGHKYDGENTEVASAFTKNTELPTSPMLFTLEKTVFKLFSNKIHNIKLQGEISNTVFTSGDEAALSFTVTNDSDIPISSIETKLVCFTTMGDPEKNKPDEVAVIESAVETTGIPAHGVANLSSIMPIPTHVQSRQFRVALSIQYRVRVTIKLFFPYTNVWTDIPVVIKEKKKENENEKCDNSKNVSVPIDDKEKYNNSDLTSAHNDPGSSGAALGETEENGDNPPAYWEVMNEK